MDIDFQYAHNAHDESERRANVRAGDALKAFDSFDWIGEAKKANEIQTRSPTLSVIFVDGTEFAWVSGCYGKGELTFVSEATFPGEVSAWFGFSKKQGTARLVTDGLTLAEARKVIEYFVKRDYDALRSLY